MPKNRQTIFASPVPASVFNPYYTHKGSCISDKDLGGEGDKFLHIRLASGEQGGDDLAASGGDLIAIAAGDFLNEAVRPQQRQSARDFSRLAPLLVSAGLAGIECGTQVTIAEATYHPLPARDGFQQGGILRRPGFECSVVPSLFVQMQVYVQ